VHDYLIVGAGLTGATIARILTDAGRQVLVLDRRSHVGGNVHDWTHHSGIRIHSYGPHYFRTSSDKLWAFVNRFATFSSYEAVVMSRVESGVEHWPVHDSYIRRVAANWTPASSGEPRNFEEACLAKMPRIVYDEFVRGYSEKQWGVPATSLAAGLAGRFEIRTGDDPRLVQHKYQGIPSEGYAAFMERMLDGIPVALGVDFLRERQTFSARRLTVFTGAIDEFFDFRLGRLAYRGQRRDHQYLEDAGFVQPCGQINNPSPSRGAHIRTLEWKHMMPPALQREARGTVVTTETAFTPTNPDNFEYPFPDERNRNLYREYVRELAACPSVLVCGRLGEYRYYDMDQAIGRAMVLANRILTEPDANGLAIAGIQ
jgi:UDP-galactopyranose mutase